MSVHSPSMTVPSSKTFLVLNERGLPVGFLPSWPSGYSSKLDSNLTSCIGRSLLLIFLPHVLQFSSFSLFCCQKQEKQQLFKTASTRGSCAKIPAKGQIILALGTSKYHQNRFHRTPKYHLRGPRSPTIGAPKYHHNVSRSTTITVVRGSRTTTVEAYLGVPKYHRGVSRSQSRVTA